MIAALITQSRAISSLSPVGDCVIGALAVFSRWTEASEAASRTGQLQQLAAGGAGEGLRDHPLPGHLHEGSPGPQTGPHRGQSTGTWQTELFLEMFVYTHCTMSKWSSSAHTTNSCDDQHLNQLILKIVSCIKFVTMKSRKIHYIFAQHVIMGWFTDKKNSCKT